MSIHARGSSSSNCFNFWFCTCDTSLLHCLISTSVHEAYEEVIHNSQRVFNAFCQSTQNRLPFKIMAYTLKGLTEKGEGMGKDMENKQMQVITLSLCYIMKLHHRTAGSCSVRDGAKRLLVSAEPQKGGLTSCSLCCGQV